METGLLVLTLMLAFVDWYAVETKQERLHFVAKPLVILALMTWFTVSAGWLGRNVWFGLALVFSLLGDVFLMFPARLFPAGLAAFLVAHICYIAGLNQEPFQFQTGHALLLALLAVLDYSLFSRLSRSPACQKLRIPVAVYIMVLSLMVFSALACFDRPLWTGAAAAFVSLGAVLFMFSDGLLAYNRFVCPTAHSHVIVMATYQLAQIALITGAVMRSGI